MVINVIPLNPLSPAYIYYLHSQYLSASLCSSWGCAGRAQFDNRLGPMPASQVQEWALATGGCFPVVCEGSSTRHEFVRSPQPAGSYDNSWLGVHTSSQIQNECYSCLRQDNTYRIFKILLMFGLRALIPHSGLLLLSVYRYAEVHGGGLEECIKWCPVKTIHRAQEKVQRSYNEVLMSWSWANSQFSRNSLGCCWNVVHPPPPPPPPLLRLVQDVSCLVDLCRQCIVFDSLSDIACCLAVIATDPAAVLVRVKNRLDPNYNSARSAGYRDVGINLRMVGYEARRMDLDGHVCEVQLILRSFADLKVGSMHSKGGLLLFCVVPCGSGLIGSL